MQGAASHAVSGVEIAFSVSRACYRQCAEDFFSLKYKVMSGCAWEWLDLKHAVLSVRQFLSIECCCSTYAGTVCKEDEDKRSNG